MSGLTLSGTLGSSVLDDYLERAAAAIARLIRGDDGDERCNQRDCAPPRMRISNRRSGVGDMVAVARG